MELIVIGLGLTGPISPRMCWYCWLGELLRKWL